MGKVHACLAAAIACLVSACDATSSTVEQALSVCGNGILEPPETCDDLNTTSGDGCSAACKLEPGFACRPGHPCQARKCEVIDGGTSGSGPLFARGNFMQMGLDGSGAFGGGLPPNDPVDPWIERSDGNGDLGFISDKDATSYTNFDGDFFTPGSPEEGWGIEIGLAPNNIIANNNHVGPVDIAGTWGAPVCVTTGLCNGRGGAQMTWTSTAPFQGLLISQTYTILDGGVFIIVDANITNTTSAPITDIFFMRNVDPDNNEPVHFDFTTTNVILHQPDGIDNTAHVRADQSHVPGDTSAISLVANDPRARVSFGGFSNRVPSQVFNAPDGDASFCNGQPCSSLGGTNSQFDDTAISIAFKFDLAANETTTLRFAYNLEPNPDDALKCATQCGDGVVDTGEGCDDGNAATGDGCDAACAVEPGFECTGTLSVCTAICGDGQRLGAEGCDDGNVVDGDGCNSTCAVENGFTCTGLTPDVCTTTCGDGIRAGAEACDDANTANGDGCTDACAVEPGFTCTGITPDTCATTCGDGVRAGAEGCDDGNVALGDGCSMTCTIEPGFSCTGGTPDVCTAACGDGVVAGSEMCDDGNASSGDGCSAVCATEPGFDCNGVPSSCTTTCGDNVKAGTEQCDDGNQTSGDGCDSTCMTEGTPPPDRDLDGILDDSDNCVDLANTGQGDRDGDGVGDDCDPNPDFPDDYGVSGGGCSAGGSGGTGGFAALVFALGAVTVRRRRRRGAAMAAVAVGLAAPATAFAETGEFSVERFRVALDREGVIGIESGNTHGHMTIDASLWLGYARDPLIIEDNDGDKAGALVSDRLASNLTFALSLFDRIRLGVSVPLVLKQGHSDSIAGVPASGVQLAGAGLGDIRLAPKIGLAKRSVTGFDIAIIPSITLPSADGSYRGDNGVTFQPEAAISTRSGALRWGANLGYRMRERVKMLDLIVDDEIFLGGGLGWRGEKMPVSLEGALQLATRAGAPFSDGNTTYAELQGGASFDVAGTAMVSAVMGFGLGNGYGAPAFRFVLTARFTLGSTEDTSAKPGTVARR